MASLYSRLTGLAGLLGSLLVAGGAAADWQLDESKDAFTDVPVATAVVTTQSNDRLTVRCDATNTIVFVYGPQMPLRADDVAVRYRLDDEPTIESTLVWENFNGRARTSLATKKSLFGEGDQDDEFLNMLEGLIKGAQFVIEANGEQARFTLRGSEKALSAVLASCDIEMPR